MDTKPTVYVVDYRNDLMASCFLLTATCRICQERHVALLHRGQAPKPNDASDRCPYCECSGTLYYGPLRDALTLLTGSTVVFLYDDPQTGFSTVEHSQVVIDTFKHYHVSTANPLAFFSQRGGEVYDT